MATTKGQRIGIWVIIIFMIVGTIGSFAIIALANQNDAADTAKIQVIEEQYKKDYEAYQEKLTAQATEMSSKYFDTFNSFSDRVSEFNADEVKELSKEDLLIGDGAEITSESTFHAYYLGWTPDGKIFDGSIQDGALKSAFEVTPGGVIEGWSEGTVGMKTGGVRLLTIPSDKAYGESGSGESIPANTPLKFIVMVVESPEQLEMPEMPKALYDYYRKQGAI